MNELACPYGHDGFVLLCVFLFCFVKAVEVRSIKTQC